MRSSVVTAALVALALGGCDSVFGLDEDPGPCDIATFSAEPTDVVAAEDFSFDWEQTLGVIFIDGAAYELDPVTLAETPIDIGPYLSEALALTPEGNALFYTSIIEPPTLLGARRGGDSMWVTGGRVPRGTFAGTPSADVFGPRRVMVKLRAETDNNQVQEYEDDGGIWTPVGEPFELATQRAPNLTPDGKTMVYTTSDGVYAAQRENTDAAFDEAKPLIMGETFRSAQLLGKCQQLYVGDGMMLRRYEP